MATITQPSGVDEHIVARVRAGSMEALGALYERHSWMLFRTAVRFCGNVAEAEEVVQDFFVGLRPALTRYRESGRFERWARRLVVRMALDRQRRDRRTDAALRRMWRPTQAASRPRGIDALALDRALEQLSIPLRQVFLLREAEGFSHDEIAELLDIAPGTSMVRLTRAKKRLRRLLG